MMKLLLTWKDQNAEEFKQNKKRVMGAFNKWGLHCINFNNLKTEVVGFGMESDITKFWGCIHEELVFHRFFYDTLEKCFLYDNGIKEDVIETGAILARKRSMT